MFFLGPTTSTQYNSMGALDSAEVRECRKRREILERNLRG